MDPVLPANQIRKVLLTGAHGTIGKVLRPALRETHLLRLSDLKSTPDLLPEEEDAPLNLQDFEAVQEAMQGVDAVVHLGGIAQEAPFESILQVNILGTHNVFEAARLAGVQRVVFASSNHAVGFYPAKAKVGPDVPQRPDTFYGLSKAFGEDLGRLYHDRFGLDVVCLRIGTFQERPSAPRHLCTWISPADMLRLTLASLQHPQPGFAVVYGVSNNTRSFASNQEASRIGYHPQDNAEDFAAEIWSQHPSTDLENMPVGGDFTDEGCFGANLEP